MIQRFETFTVLIAKISRTIRKIKNHEMAEHGLRSAHVSCLYYLYTFDSLTVTELVEKCEEDKATVSRALVFLKSNGYLFQESCTHKRYKTPLILTDKGRTVGKQIAEKINFVLNEINVELSESQRIEFYSALTNISTRLEAVSLRLDEDNE